jgi:hypothetical protein
VYDGYGRHVRKEEVYSRIIKNETKKTKAKYGFKPLKLWFEKIFRPKSEKY